MRTLPLLAAGLMAAGLAACNKPADKTADAAPAASAQPGPGGPGGFQMPEKQTLDDMLKRTDDRFAKVDANGDGKITPEEIDAAIAAREAAGGGGPGGPGGGRGGGFGMLARADANKDGVVTKEEAEAQTRKRFEMMDANHDGTVTRDEMQAAREAMRAQQGAGDGPPPPPSN